ncbi:mariner Mos1 transposase [Trichonephila clavipes]|nr:mariner Mos1 transposase [Trichonephila clavipes]
MITNFFIPELNNHDVQELWFQQDGATCHTARATIDLLKDTFGDRLISRFGPVNWPPRSCDLTPLDYFLWGDRRLSVHPVTKLVDLDREAVRCILTDKLHLRKICVKVVPKVLFDDSKQCRTDVCVDMLEHIANEPHLLESVVTYDKTWSFSHDRGSKLPVDAVKVSRIPKTPKKHACQNLNSSIIAARRLHYLNILEFSKIEVTVAGSIAFLIIIKIASVQRST